ncbi:Hypothetical_protein [Hexamita inflata]|uniref:Hypothetical_protein n=1 Tax=Hexamita inflata TaxID=28002 RepID=A0AA86NU23_9EUKA|nr:Hypothetical protein HINF_LOCUS13118 [Hexamita inflata]
MKQSQQNMVRRETATPPEEGHYERRQASRVREQGKKAKPKETLDRTGSEQPSRIEDLEHERVRSQQQQQHDSLNSNNPTIHLNAIYKYILVISLQPSKKNIFQQYFSLIIPQLKCLYLCFNLSICFFQTTNKSQYHKEYRQTRQDIVDSVQILIYQTGKSVRNISSHLILVIIFF